MHREAHCFARFDYPSQLPDVIRERMCEITQRVIRGLGLTHSMFNVELIYDRSSDRVSVIEVNPRICGQFGDLYQRVHGINGYEIALALATGRQVPPLPGERQWTCSSSVPLRVLQPSRVLAAPTPADTARVEAEFAPCLVWNECRAGETLADFHDEDGSSQRYGVLNLAGRSPSEIEAKAVAIRNSLGYQIEPLSANRAD
jgi:hypothetical protein